MTTLINPYCGLPIISVHEAADPKYVIGNRGLRQYQFDSRNSPAPVATLGTGPTAIKVWLREHLEPAKKTRRA
jgi:hypothetical protein